jgi:response regulator NasT
MTRVGPGTHILIVDDDRLILSTLAEGLRKGGYRVSEAGDAAAARELAGRDKPDLALLDVRIPGGSGIELAQDLASEHCVPFIFLSAYDDPAIIEKATELGALGYLVKPLDVPQIIPSIEAALARSAQIRSLTDTGEQLSQALESGRETSMAIGILMERRALDRDEAFQALRSYARSQRRRIHEVAAEIVDAVEKVNKAGRAR